MSDQVSSYFRDKCFAVCYQTNVVTARLTRHCPVSSKPAQRHLVQGDIKKLQFDDQCFRQQDFPLRGAEAPAFIESVQPIPTSSNTVKCHS
ncbi:hypothetical protein C6Q02_03635 [Burkholderia multivorans]|nr:hypothetical protein C6Q02_03635 [Burkholderia multivorans]PRF79746.1 hypothetical protein C6Q12_04430 [Burkholderia multivorans]